MYSNNPELRALVLIYCAAATVGSYHKMVQIQIHQCDVGYQSGHIQGKRTMIRTGLRTAFDLSLFFGMPVRSEADSLWSTTAIPRNVNDLDSQSVDCLESSSPLM
jgi:hypothetical protein